MSTIHGITEARIFHDGTVTEPRLLHPESVAIAADGAVWCGGELGHLYRISPDGATLEERTCTGGFILGIAFDRSGRLYACDLKHKCVFRYDPGTDELTTFASGAGDIHLKIPNWPVVDATRNVLYVSDSNNPAEAGPGVWRFDLDTGDGQLWYNRDLAFANGMALSPDGTSLYVAETFGRRIIRIPIERMARPASTRSLPNSPVSCRMAWHSMPRAISTLPATNHPAYCGFAPTDQSRHCWTTRMLTRSVTRRTAPSVGAELFIANLGRWHVTILETGTPRACHCPLARDTNSRGLNQPGVAGVARRYHGR